MGEAVALRSERRGGRGDGVTLFGEVMRRLDRFFGQMMRPARRNDLLSVDRLFCVEQLCDVTFSRLNRDWNAHPVSPALEVGVKGSDLWLRFVPDRVEGFRPGEDDLVGLKFLDADRYRVTAVNDHGFYLGQCRFSGAAPTWGDFFEIGGETKDSLMPEAWVVVDGVGARHFHFYLKDETFECKAGSVERVLAGGLWPEGVTFAKL
ncbi:MAG: hypothetical protein ABJL67_24335 [Sulfitobacter sp.]